LPKRKAGELSRAALKTCIYQEEKNEEKERLTFYMYMFLFSFFAFFLVFTLLQLTALGQ
jgi:hypothetical protein